MIDINTLESSTSLDMSGYKLNTSFVDGIVISRQFFNGSSTEVVVVLRNGLKFSIYNDKAVNRNNIVHQSNIVRNMSGNRSNTNVKVATRPMSDEIWIKETYTISAEKAKGLYETYKDILYDTKVALLSTSMTVVLEELIKEYELNNGIAGKPFPGELPRPNDDYNICIIHEFKTKHLITDIAYYVPELDIVLTQIAIANSILHPFSDTTLIDRKYRELLKQSTGTNYLINFIDNENKFGLKYMVMGNSTIKISPKKNANKKSGIYYCIYEFDSSGDLIIQEKFITAAEAKEKIGLYDTEEEAIFNGDKSKQQEKELVDAKAKIEILKTNNEKLGQENTTIKYKLDADKLLREDKSSVLTHSIKTEDTLLKFALTAISTVLGIWLIVEKSKK